ncbi:MAG: hypothetical protein O3A74_00960 [archaeon]|nr:hypothetical protein [archaeon]
MSNARNRIPILMVLLMLLVPLSALVTEGTQKTVLQAENKVDVSSTISSTVEQFGWGNQTTFAGSSTDDASQVLVLENHSVIITRKGSTTLSNGTNSNTNGSSTVLVLIYDLNNTLIKHYHFGGSSSTLSNSEVHAVAKNPLGGFAISGCYWGGAAFIGTHRFSSYGSNEDCFHGFLVSFNSSFEVDYAKEMIAYSSNIASQYTWSNLAIDDSGNIFMSGIYKSCNSNSCLYFFDTDNSGNVKKPPAVSSYCGTSSDSNTGYVYVAKISASGAWQWVNVAGGTTTAPVVYDIEYLNGSIFIAGTFQSCLYGAGGSSWSSTSTANFGTYSFTSQSKCWSSGTSVSCSSFTRAFVASITSSGSWDQLINTSGEIILSPTYVPVNPPRNLDLNSEGATLLIAGQYTSQSWGMKFGDYTLPSTGKNSFFGKFAANLSYLDSFTIGSSTDQASCPLFHIDNGSIWVTAKYHDDFVLDNTTYVRSMKGEVFAKLDTNFDVSSMIDLSGTDPDNCKELSSIGSKSDSYFALVQDVMGATIGSTTYPTSSGSFPAVVEFGDDYDGDSVANAIDNDDDGDNVLDIADACPRGMIFQSRLATDRDQDGCRDSDEDSDDDGDGKLDNSDQCATGTMYWIRNSTTDYDDDGCNDASEDFNDDNDNYQDYEDMCPRLVGNSTYSNEKGCPDDDGDGRANLTDPFPSDPNEWKDTDQDGVGDNGDAFPYDATQSNDTDSDGYGDNSNGNSGDACPSTWGNSTLDRYGCVDSDGDGYSNIGDDFPYNPTQHNDRDGDGYGDNQSSNATEVDAFPSDGTQWNDTDGDGHGDNKYGTQGDHFPNNPNRWQDSDEDGYANEDDAFDNDATQWNDTDGDGYGDNPNGSNPDAFPNDPTEWRDGDGDGVGDNSDAFPVDATQWNDTDGDGHGDNKYGNQGDHFPNDPTRWRDSDEDGVADEDDAFPNDPTQQYDRDGDGYGDNATGNNADEFPDDSTEWEDSDNDGVGDNSDLFPYDPTQISDEDGDGYGDNPSGSNADAFPQDETRWSDTDGDGVANQDDAFPNDATQWADTDGDGYGDNPNGTNPDVFPEDATQHADRDGDGFGDNPVGMNADAFPSDTTQWSDQDGDGYGDNPTGRLPDQFPNNPTQYIDADGDGLGDNQSGTDADPYLNDFDNDGYPDSEDPLPKLASPGDKDNDGVPDAEDVFPEDFRESKDSDGDGEGDNADVDDDNDGWTDIDEIRQGADPMSSSSQPVEGFEVLIPSTQISLGAWDIIGILTGVPLALWIGLGLLTRGERGRRFEDDLDQAESLEELNIIAARYESSLMWKMIGPHQGLRLERIRTEIERDRFAAQLKSLPEIKTDTEQLPSASAVSTSQPAESSSPPDASVEAQKTDEAGYEWYKDSGGTTYYRPAGSGNDWQEHKG